MRFEGFNGHGVKYKRTYEETYYKIKIEDIEKCKYCKSSKIVKNGVLKETIYDIPLNSPTVLTVITNKYRCKACGNRFKSSANFKHCDHRITSRLHNFIIENCKKYMPEIGKVNTYELLGRKCGLSSRVIMRIWKRYKN